MLPLFEDVADVLGTGAYHATREGESRRQRAQASPAASTTDPDVNIKYRVTTIRRAFVVRYAMPLSLIMMRLLCRPP